MDAMKLLTAYREELKKIQIKNNFTDEQMISYRVGFMDAISQYEQRITSNISTVRHGKWEICSDGYYPYCSVCKSEPKSKEMTDYCPHCGAYMKGDKK